MVSPSPPDRRYSSFFFFFFHLELLAPVSAGSLSLPRGRGPLGDALGRDIGEIEREPDEEV